MSNFTINSSKNIKIANIDTYVIISNASIDNLYSTTLPSNVSNNKHVATTEYVNNAITSLNIKQDSINTINLNASIGNFSELYTITPTNNNNTTRVATTGYVNTVMQSNNSFTINTSTINASVGNFSYICSENPPTGTDDTTVATTRFVNNAIAASGGTGGGGGGINNGENYINGYSRITYSAIETNNIKGLVNISTPNIYGQTIRGGSLSVNNITTGGINITGVFDFQDFLCNTIVVRENAQFNSSFRCLGTAFMPYLNTYKQPRGTSDDTVASTSFVDDAIKNTTVFNVNVETATADILRVETIQPKVSYKIDIESNVDITGSLSFGNLSTRNFGIGTNNGGEPGQAIVCTPTGINWGYPIAAFNNTANSSLNMARNNIYNVYNLSVENAITVGSTTINSNGLTTTSDVLSLSGKRLFISGSEYINIGNVGSGYVSLNGNILFNNAIPQNGTYLTYNMSAISWSQVPWQGTATSNLSMGDSLSINTTKINSNTHINVDASVFVNISSPYVVLNSSNIIQIGNQTTPYCFINASSISINASSSLFLKSPSSIMMQTGGGLNNGMFLYDTIVNFSSNAVNFIADNVNVSATSIRFRAPIENYFMSYNESQGTNISTALGYIVPKLGFPNIVLSTTPTVIDTLSITAFGVWMFNWSCTIITPSLPTTCCVSNLSTSPGFTKSGFINISTNTYEASGCDTIVLPPSVCPLYLIYSSSILLAAFNYKATRIA